MAVCTEYQRSRKSVALKAALVFLITLFTLPNAAFAKPKIAKFSLVRTDTGEVLTSELPKHSTVDLSKVGTDRLTVVVETSGGDVKRVDFLRKGKLVHQRLRASVCLRRR